MYWDRFDIVIAHYCYCMHYHNGQASREYERLCRISKYYKPGMLGAEGDMDSSPNAKEIYQQLVENGI